MKGAGKRTHYCARCLAERARAERQCPGCKRRPVTAKYAKLCEVCRAEARKRRRAAQAAWDREQRKRKPQAPRPARKRDDAFEWRLTKDRNGVALEPGERLKGDMFPRLPAVPLAAAMQRLIDREDRAASLNDPVQRGPRGECKEVVCLRLGIPTRTLTAWQLGERLLADFDVIDKVLTRAEWLWWEVYDEESVRRPALRVRVRDQKKDAPGKSLRWQTVRHLRYGDLGPDREVLALIEQTFTGEGVEVTEQLTLAGTNTLGPPPGVTAIEEYRGAMAERRAA